MPPGSFALPRSVIKAVSGDTTSSTATTTTPTLSITVSRERHEIKKGMKTTGTLDSATVQSEGWLELVTSSSESSFQGCSTRRHPLRRHLRHHHQSTPKNCGACGKACLSTQYCSAGRSRRIGHGHGHGHVYGRDESESARSTVVARGFGARTGLAGA